MIEYKREQGRKGAAERRGFYEIYEDAGLW